MAFPYIEGGLTVSPSFISAYELTDPSSIRVVTPQVNIITGEDGVRYYLGLNSGGIRLFNADTGVLAISRNTADIRTDAAAEGIVPPAPQGTGMAGGAFVLPETPYVIVIGGAAFSTSTDKLVVYYKINSAGSLEIVGGYAGNTGSLNVQFSPASSYGDTIKALGYVIAQPSAGAVNDIPHMYPIAVAYTGESRSTVVVIPSVNYIIANTPITETLSNNWLVKEDSLSSSFDANIMFVDNNTAPGSRGFFLPRPGSGSRYVMLFYNVDLDAHNALTASPASTYLTTYAALYPDGLISAVDIALAGNESAFGFDTTLSSVTPAFHAIIKNLDFTPAFPFEDDEDNYDGSAGTAADNYYTNPSVYPSDIGDPAAPWFLFFPRIYRKAGERDKLGIRVCAYDPAEDVIYNLDFGKGQVYTLGVDVDSDTNPASASVWWDRTTGQLDVFIGSTASGEKGLIVSTFGSFVPVNETVSVDSEELLTRAWGFDLDSHSFYPLRLGQQGTFVYDLYTQQWSQWQTQGYEIWNAVHGVAKWNGMIVAGDISDGTLWQVDPDATLDEDTKPITHTVTGILSNRERSPQRLMELRVAGSVGAPYIDGAAVTLSWSDDQGQTYSTPITVNLESGDNSQVIRFRSLGRFDAPLRIFDIADVGGMARIDGVDVEIR